MQWSEVVDNPYFENLPFKIELNRYGKIEMTPASNKHSRLQFRLGSLLESKLKKGEVLVECSIQTSEGVKVADVAWCSKAFLKQHGYETPFSQAPEICVEVVSPSNSRQEMREKVQLYLAAGAEEFWVVWENEMIDYYDKTGPVEKSGYGVVIDF
ncbi:MAG: Uma2 family endonuclease [Methylococcales bacterium]